MSLGGLNCWTGLPTALGGPGGLAGRVGRDAFSPGAVLAAGWLEDFRSSISKRSSSWEDI